MGTLEIPWRRRGCFSVAAGWFLDGLDSAQACNAEEEAGDLPSRTGRCACRVLRSDLVIHLSYPIGRLRRRCASFFFFSCHRPRRAVSVRRFSFSFGMVTNSPWRSFNKQCPRLSREMTKLQNGTPLRARAFENLSILWTL